MDALLPPLGFIALVLLAFIGLVAVILKVGRD